MRLKIYGESLMREIATQDRLFEWVRSAMIEVSEKRVVMPLRRSLDMPSVESRLGMMPGYLESEGVAGIKLVSLVPSHRRHGSSHMGLFILYDDRGLVPIALMDGSILTALRTAAASAVATDVLARGGASHLALIGAGEQAEAHLHAIRAIRPITDLSIWNRTDKGAKRLASLAHGLRVSHHETVASAVAHADIVCTVTGSSDPILQGGDLLVGSHVNLVGSSHAGAREADRDALLRSRIFVDSMDSARAQAGEIIEAVNAGVLGWSNIAGEIGSVLAGTLVGREGPRQITVYKSLGVAPQDIVTASRIHDIAEAQGLGQCIDLN